MDRLAARYLGRAEPWWVICDYSDIFFPLELEAGAVLRRTSGSLGEAPNTFGALSRHFVDRRRRSRNSQLDKEKANS